MSVSCGENNKQFNFKFLFSPPPLLHFVMGKKDRDARKARRRQRWLERSAKKNQQVHKYSPPEPTPTHLPSPDSNSGDSKRAIATTVEPAPSPAPEQVSIETLKQGVDFAKNLYYLAEYKYFKALRERDMARFKLETSDFVVDRDHKDAEFFFPAKKKPAKNKPWSDAVKKKWSDAYKQLAIACHPDKCSSPRAKDIFATVSRAYEEQDETVLQKLHDQLVAGQDVDKWEIPTLASDENKKSDANDAHADHKADEKNEPEAEPEPTDPLRMICKVWGWQRENWYLWFHDHFLYGPKLREILVSPETLAKRDAQRYNSGTSQQSIIVAFKS